MWKLIPQKSITSVAGFARLDKQNTNLTVVRAMSSLVFILFVTNGIAFHAQAEETPPPPPEEAVADIEAKIRHLKVIKASTSMRVYLLDLSVETGSDPSSAAAQPSADGAEKPTEQKILLVRNGDENIMGLRVLRDITGTSQVIVKKIKQYGDHSALDIGQEYAALEKLSDVVPPPPTPQDKADMAEVEPAPLAFDPDLDTGSSPSPGSENDTDSDGDHVDRLGASIEEKTVPFEKQRNWLSVAFGTLRNTPDGGQISARYYMAGGIRYGYDVRRRIFVTKDERLDTFTIEGSLFYYSISGLDSSDSTTSTTSTDSYTIAPIAATGRYTYYYNEDFGIFAYGGLMKNMVLSSQNSNPDRVANLGQVVPAIGVGALLRVGPQWYTRIDFGLDMFAANLMIRF